MVVFILITGFLLRMVSLNQSLWLDEAAQAIESARPFSQQFSIAADFWPPLYHVVLHIWMWGGKSEIYLRFLSVIISVGAIYLLCVITTKITDKKVALLTTFLFSFSAYHIWYSQEVRPYALSVFMALLATHFLLEVQLNRYIVAAIFFLYTTYLAPFVLVAHGIYIVLFSPQHFRKWLRAMLLSILAFLPWLPHFWQQLSIGKELLATLPGWNEAVSVPLGKVLPQIAAKFILGRITFDNKLWYAGLVGGLCIICLFLLLHIDKKCRQVVVKIGILAITPILLAFLVSFVLPVIAPQRVIFCLPFFYILLALGISSFKRSKKTLLFLFVGLNIYSIYLYAYQPRFQREQWREAVQFVENARSSQSVAVFVFPDTFAPWQWYSRGVVATLAIAPAFTINDQDLAKFKPNLLKAERIFYFHYLTDLTDKERKTEAFIKNLGFIEKEIKDFPGVGFISTYDKTFAFR